MVLRLAAVCLIALACSPSTAPAQPVPVTPEEAQAWTRYLVPLPKSLSINYKVEVAPDLVAISPPAGADVVIEQACKELRQTLGLDQNAPNPPNPSFTITLALGGPESAPLTSLKNSNQASITTAEPGNAGLRIIALHPRGLYYGAKSLQQLVAAYSTPTLARIPIVEITDWPDMADRGLWGSDHFAWLRWLADRKMNIGEQISARSVTSDGKGHSWLKDGREPMVTEGPYYGFAPVPAVLHLEQVYASGLFQYYPQLIGVGGQYGAICYSQPEFVNVLADWIVELRSLPFVEEVDVWMTENLHGDGGCHCALCSPRNRNVLEAQTIVAAWEQAKLRMGVPIGLRILTSEETSDDNDLVFAAVPSDVKVWYYHSLFTYNAGRIPIISSDVLNLANSGRYAGVCPSISIIGFSQPFSSAEFVKYRMNEFVTKNISGVLGYATPAPLVDFCGYNVDASAEWSWNLNGRSLHEYALSYAVRKGYPDPEKFAQWSDAMGKLQFDLQGSEWPRCEDRAFPGYVARLLADGDLPSLGSGSTAYRGPWAEFKTAQQLDDGVALAAKALALAKDMGISEYWNESVYADGLVNSLRALYKLRGLVVGGTVAPANREKARFYFGVYVNSIRQSIDALQAWCLDRNDETGSVSRVTGILQHCIDGEAGTNNPGMLQVAADCGCTPTLVYTGEPALTIADAKLRGAGVAVRLYGDILTGAVAGLRYLQEPDRSAGIRINTSAAVAAATPVSATGYLQLVNGELVVEPDLVQAAGAAVAVAPLAMPVRSLGGGAFGGQPAVKEYRTVQGSRQLVSASGLNNTGVTIRVAGIVTAIADDCFYLDDGSKCDDGSGFVGVRAVLADPAWEKPAIGQFVTVTGVSSTYFDRGNTWRAVYVPSASGIGDVAVPTEFIVDEDAAVSTGSWTYNTGADAYNSDYQHTAAASAESATTTWRPTLPRAGNYNVYVMYSSGADRTADAVYTVSGSTGTQAYPVDQTTGGGTWQFLGMQTFTAGTSGHVRLTNVAPGVGTMVVADAVKFVYAGAPGSDPPVITTQPVSQSVCAGATVTFTVAATGSGTLNYQWRKGTADITDGGRYAGATTANLVVSSCDASDAAANYNCLVSSDYGSATSDNASLIVGAIPPAPAALAASAIGLDTITWNWGSSTGAASYRLWTAATGGTQIGGTLTGTSYVETGLNPGTSYSRYVEAVGQCGGVSSRTLLGPAVTTARYCVENGDFESGFTSGVANMWRKGSGTGTFARETAIKRDGTSSQKISDSSGGDQYTAYLYQKLNVQPNRGYAYQVYHRRQVTSGAVIRLGVNYTGGITADAVAESNGNSGEWKLKTLNFTSGATGVVTVMFCAGYNGGDTTVYVDGAYLLPQAPTATGGSTTISQGASATITASGGFGGSSSELHWYTGPNGTAAHVGTGTSLMVSPASTTVYYPRWQSASSCGGCCNSADGAPVTVTVNP